MTRIGIIFAVLCVAGSVAFAKTQAATQATTAPTLVTMKCDRVPATQALRELFAKADVPIAGIDSPRFADRLAGVDVSLDVADQPFNSVAIDLFRQAGLEPMQWPTAGHPTGFTIRPTTKPTTQKQRPLANVSNGVRLSAAGPTWFDAPICSAGPFTLVAQSARRSSQWDFENNAAPGPQRELTVSFRVVHDPRIRLFAIADHIDVDEAKDEHSQSLLSPTHHEPATARPINNVEATMWDLQAVLAYPKSDARKLALLRGHLKATIITRDEAVDFLDDAGKPIPSGNANGLTFTTGSFDVSGDASVLHVTFEDPSGGHNHDANAWEAMRAQVIRDAFTASDGKGGYYWITPMLTAWRENKFWDIQIRCVPFQAFRDDAKPPVKPSKLTWHVPVDVEDVTVPVEIKDLPLP